MKKYTWNEIILGVRKANREEHLSYKYSTDAKLNVISCNVMFDKNNLDPKYSNVFVTPKTFFMAKFIVDNQGRIDPKLEKILDGYIKNTDRDLEVERMMKAYGESWFLSLLRMSKTSLEDCIGMNEAANKKFKEVLDDGSRFLKHEPKSTGFVFEKIKEYYKTTYEIEDEKRLLAISNFVYNQANVNLDDAEKMKFMMFLHKPQIHMGADNALAFYELKANGGDYLCAYGKMATKQNIKREKENPLPASAIF